MKEVHNSVLINAYICSKINFDALKLIYCIFPRTEIKPSIMLISNFHITIAVYASRGRYRAHIRQRVFAHVTLCNLAVTL